ncbi:MAG TPA: sterol desaturase family protein [Gaiellaceae bacterium]|nr:sterol desaturase family protein [Gaiellaceae bacterium]
MTSVRNTSELQRAEQLRASPPIFPSPRLDRLTRAHPATPAVLFLPAVAALAALAVSDMRVVTTLALAAGGYMFWTLCEYWGHRVVFHFEPDHGIGRQLHWMIHGVHHDHPNDPRRLVLPPAFSLPLATLFFGFFVLALGTPHAFGVAAGFYLGYVVYDTVHFALHHTTPKGRVGRLFRELHMRHHFEDHERGFGVSAPWWDIVFRTRPRRSAKRAT